MPERGIPEAFWTRLRRAPRDWLLLDYDGTLAPFREDRRAAFPAPGVRRALSALAGAGTRPALVSGRPAREVLELLAPTNPLEVWGCHGAERIDERGDLHLPSLTREQARLLKLAKGAAADLLRRDLIEVKSTSVAAHGRPLDPTGWERLRENLRKEWERLGPPELAEVRDFDAGLEFRLLGWNKGRVVLSYLEKAGPADVVAFAGDDDTDEDGFRALAGGGLSIRVGKDTEETAASVLLEGTADLVAFMKRWARERRHRQK